MKILARLLPLLAIAAALPSAADDARIYFKDNRRVWDIELLGRTSAGTIKLKRKDQGDSLFEEDLKGIKAIAFKMPFDTDSVRKRYDDGDFEKLITELNEPLKQYITFQDISNNATTFLMILANSYHFAGKYQEGITLYERLQRNFPKNSQEYREILLLKSIALHATSRSDETAKLLAQLSPPEVTDPTAPLYWYSMAKLQMTTNDFYRARENVARIVAFSPKDFTWFTPALYMSGENYARTNAFDTARQIAEELRIVAPGTKWVDEAAKLKTQVDVAEAKAAAEKERAEREAAAKAALSPLRQKPGGEQPNDTMTDVKPDAPAAGTQPGRPDIQ